jgi:hypothetical protein
MKSFKIYFMSSRKGDETNFTSLGIGTKKININKNCINSQQNKNDNSLLKQVLGRVRFLLTY